MRHTFLLAYEVFYVAREIESVAREAFLLDILRMCMERKASAAMYLAFFVAIRCVGMLLHRHNKRGDRISIASLLFLLDLNQGPSD